MPLNLRNGVNPLPAPYGTERLFRFKGSDTAIRFSVTSGRIAPSVLTGIGEAYASRQIGRTSVVSWANRKFWYTRTDDLNFEIFVDRTEDAVTGGVFSHLPNAPWNNSPYRGPIYGPVLGTGAKDAHLAALARKWGVKLRRTTVQSAFQEGSDAALARNEIPICAAPMTVLGGNIGPSLGAFADPATMGGFKLALKKHILGLSAPILCSTQFQIWNVPGGFAMTINYNDASAVYAGPAWKAALEEMAAWFGSASAREGSTDVAASDAAAFTFWTHPGVGGAVPAVGYRLHGLHPSIDHFRVVGGEVVEITYRSRGVDMANFVEDQKPYVDAKYLTGMEAMRVSFQNDIGTKMLRIKAYADVVGPFDVYDSRQIRAALAQGAAKRDIDEYVTAGKRCDAWRKAGLSKKPARSLAYVESPSRAITSVTPRRSGGALQLSAIPADNSIAVFEDPPEGYGFDANTQYASVEALEAALGAAYPLVAWVSAAEYVDGQEDLPSIGEDRGDMPMVWWKSLGFTDFEGVLRLFATASLVPVTTNG